MSHILERVDRVCAFSASVTAMRGHNSQRYMKYVMKLLNSLKTLPCHLQNHQLGSHNRRHIRQLILNGCAVRKELIGTRWNVTCNGALFSRARIKNKKMGAITHGGGFVSDCPLAGRGCLGSKRWLNSFHRLNQWQHHQKE